MVSKLVVVALVVLGSFGCAAPASSARGPRATVQTGDRPVTIHAEAGSVWASPQREAMPRRAWTMPASGPVVGLWLEPVADGGHVVRFTQGGVAWRGELDADLRARGPLAPVNDAIAPEAAPQNEAIAAAQGVAR
jgi:hypothetical protein